MKILQVLPELNSGGVEEVTLSLARYLHQQGHESIVLSNGGSLVAQLESEGSRHIQLPVHKKSPLSLRWIPKLKKLLLSEQPNIIHLRSRVPAWLLMLALRQLPPQQRPRVVTTVHGFYSVNCYSAIMTKGERVICVSESVKDYVLAQYPKTPSERLHVIYEGLDEQQYHPDFAPSPDWLEDWYREHPQTRNRILLTLPGRLTRLKGHRQFLSLIAKLRQENPTVHGLIVGGAHRKKRAYLSELEELATSLGIAEHITFTGARPDMREILSISRISYSLSTQPESFGLTVLEALSLGTPVIGGNHGGVAEILAALFPAGTLSEVPPTTETLLAKTQEILNEAPPVAPNTLFLSERVHQTTLDLYQNLLASTVSG